MTTSSRPNDSLPLNEPAGKQATGSSKPAAKSSISPNVSNELSTKTNPINLVWAEEITAEFGVAGPLGKRAAAELADKLSCEINRKFTRPKLAKLVQKAVLNAIS